MRVIRRLSDRVIERLVPKHDASALYYWRYRCTPQWVCTVNGHHYNSYVKEYVHDGSGTVTERYFLGCC